MTKLKKSISAFGLLMTSLSAMIGSGWLLSSMYAAKIAGPAAVLSWLIGGFMIGFIAICFSELSTAFPVAGGIARYGHFSHGGCVSFIISWLAWLSCVAVAPTEAIAILQYASRFFEGLVYKQNGEILLTSVGIAWAALLVFIMTWVNNKGIQVMIKYNNILTIWKIIVPTSVLAILAYTQFNTSNFTSSEFMPFGIEGVLSALSTVVIFSFLGFRECTSLAEEVKNPQTAIPIAAIGSVIYCTIFYMLMQAVFVGALNPASFAQGWQNLQFDFDAGPFAGLALILGLKWLATIIYIDATIAPMGAGLVYTATTSRLLIAMSKNGFLPKSLQKLNENQVPQLALVFNALIGLALLAPFEDWVALVKFQSVAIVLAYSVGPVSLLVLRTLAPNQPRPFKLPMPYLFANITLFICFLLVHWSGFDNVVPLVISSLIGLVIYLMTSGKKDLWHAAWLIPMLVSLLTTGYLGQFGGIGAISTLQEICVLFVSSSVCLYLGIKHQLSSKQHASYVDDDSLTYYDAI